MSDDHLRIGLALRLTDQVAQNGTLRVGPRLQPGGRFGCKKCGVSPEEGLDRLELALRQAGIAVVRDQLQGRPVIVGNWTKFRWRWLATKLYLFVIARPFSSAEATTEQLDQFLTSARQYAISHKTGLPLGFQTGVAVIAVAVVDELGQDAADWASKAHGSRFGAIAYPVSVELREGRGRRPDSMALGAIYVPYLRSIVDSIIAPAFGDHA